MGEIRYLTVAEAAKRLRAHPETVRRWLKQGKIYGSRPGGAKLGWRIAETEVERVLTATAAPTANGGEHIPAS